MSEADPGLKANMGQPIPRYDARAKVTGMATYAADQRVAGPAFAYLVTSTIARGKIVKLDDRAARLVPGVLDVMTHANRPEVKPILFFFAGGPGLTHVPPLDGPKIHHAGQIIAMVLADTFEAAREAAYRIEVEYARETPSTDFDSPGVVKESTVTVAPMHEDPKLGDAEAALAKSPVMVEGRYATPAQHHNSIELYATTAEWQGDELTIYEPSQFVYGLREGVSSQLGMSRDKVHVVSPYLGGAFGGKAATTQRTALVALAAKRLNRPVKLVATRDQGFSISGYRQETRHHIRLGADRDGRLTGYHHDIWELTGRTDPYCNGGVESSAAMYRFPTVKSTGYLVHADRNVPCFMRSPPEVPCMFALESAIDELALKLGMDPVELRRVNDTDRNMVTGKPYSSRSLMLCYDQAAAAFGWSKRAKAPAAMREGEWLVGYGCATACYPTQMSSAIARVRLSADGRAVVETAAHEVGQGVYTVIQQETARVLGVQPDRVTVRVGDSKLPPGPIAGGSVSTASASSAVEIACQQILARLGINGAASETNRAAAFARLGVQEVEETGTYLQGGRLKNGDGLYHAQVDIAGGTNGEKTSYAFGAEFVEVHVHARTREIRVPRIVGAFAAGRIINPRTARSQLMGGMIWGIGSALHEFTELDRREARYINDNLAEYLLPVNADIRDVEVIMVPEVDETVNPAGVKGLGELANVGTAAAIANAVYHATGKRIRELPITIDKLI